MMVQGIEDYKNLFSIRFEIGSHIRVIQDSLIFSERGQKRAWSDTLQHWTYDVVF